MRKLIVLLLLVAGLWSGYWFVGSNAIEKAANQWFADAAGQGLIAEKTALSVQGFPNRFDLTVEGLELADPDNGYGWKAPVFQIFAMTWKPWHIIAGFPLEQQISTPDEVITLTSQDMMASLRTQVSTDLPLAAVIIEGNDLAATSSAGWAVGARWVIGSIKTDEEAGITAGVAGAPDEPNTYVLKLDVADLTPDPVALAKVTAEADLPAAISVTSFLATAQMTAPIDRHMEDTHPMLAGFELNLLAITWGDLSIEASGSIVPDAAGFAEGRFEFDVTNWQKLVAALVATGTIKPEMSQTVENMLGAMAKQSGDPNVLKLPLIMKDGRMSVGPIPLGPAPVMMPPEG